MAKLRLQSCQGALFDFNSIETSPIQTARREENHVFDLMDALTAPVLTFSESWADPIPKRLLNIITIARLIQLKKGEELASYPECVVYMYTRTLEGPMDSEWTDIYTHISCHTLETHFGEDHWKETSAPKQLSEWLQSKLKRLQRHIYEKRRQFFKQQYQITTPKTKLDQPGERHSEQKEIPPTLFQ